MKLKSVKLEAEKQKILKKKKRIVHDEWHKETKKNNFLEFL